MYIVGNFKANKNISQVLSWVNEFNKLQEQLKPADVRVVVCPSYVSLPEAAKLIDSLKWKFSCSLGSQDISIFPEGSYTGEVAGSMLKDYVKFTLIGHSERRRFFHEDIGMISKKIDSAIKNNLTPIVCLSSLEEVKQLTDSKYQGMVAYEPLQSIGSGFPEAPDDVEQFLYKTRTIIGNNELLYGGSVTSSNIDQYLNNKIIKGFLVGKASLDPESFLNIILHVAKI